MLRDQRRVRLPALRAWRRGVNKDEPGVVLNQRKVLLAAVAGISAVAATAAISRAAVVPAPTMAGKLWLIKENDLATIGGSAADFDWVTCGITTDPVNIRVVRACGPGQVRTYTSYTWLR